MLVKYGAARISVHHNLFVDGYVRQPTVSRRGYPSAGTTLDMRNNVVWGWNGGEASVVTDGARANLVANLYANPGASPNDQAQAVMVCRGDGEETRARRSLCKGGALEARAYAFTAGNVSLDGAALDTAGNVRSPFPAPSVPTIDACTAAAAVVAHAGVRPLDTVDASLLSRVSIDGCRPGAAARRSKEWDDR
jgi:hypothetical protein